MTTDDEMLDLPPRDVSALMNLGTYQDMTDEEIQSIIDFKVEHGILAAVNESIRMESRAVNQLILESQMRVEEESRAYLDELRSHSLLLRTVEPIGDDDE